MKMNRVKKTKERARRGQQKRDNASNSLSKLRMNRNTAWIVLKGTRLKMFMMVIPTVVTTMIEEMHQTGGTIYTCMGEKRGP